MVGGHLVLRQGGHHSFKLLLSQAQCCSKLLLDHSYSSVKGTHFLSLRKVQDLFLKVLHGVQDGLEVHWKTDIQIGSSG